MIRLALVILICVVHGVSCGQTWSEALRTMPVPVSALPIERSNCISVCLTNFQSNAVVKALIFLPGISDDLYLINRDKPPLGITATNVFEALTRLTSVTRWALTFNAPFLLVHLARDVQTPAILARDSRTRLLLQEHRSFPYLVCTDMRWDSLQPILQNGLKRGIRPEPRSEDAWHFARHNFAAWGLTDWELLSAISITARTKVVIEKKRIRLELNRPE